MMNNIGLRLNVYSMKLKVFLLVLMFIFTLACTKSNDKPPDLDTPLPAAHFGIYSSNDANFTFKGDGKTVFVHLSDRYIEALENPPNDTEFMYTFTWYDFGEYRYDGATNLILYHKETGASINFNLCEASSYERICLSYPTPDKENQIIERVSD